MPGLKTIILLLITLLFTEGAQASVSYRTKELRRLANEIGVVDERLHPGVNNIGECTVMVDDSMTVRHVGLTLFKEDVKQMSNRLVLEFVERYFLQLTHPAPNSSAALMIHSDGITFSKGKWQDISKISPTVPFKLDYHLMRYTLSWQAENTTLVFSFPGKYQLICGENLLEAEEHLMQDISTTAYSYIPTISLSDMQPSSMNGYYIKKGGWYYTESINSTTYYQIDKDSTIIPVVNGHFVEESVADIMMCPMAAKSFMLDITMHRYGFKDTEYSVPLCQWISYCHQNGCDIYCGIESVSSEMVKATVIAVNDIINFNHLLTVTLPTSAIENGEGIVKGNLDAFIPTHNIINLKSKYKKAKKIENRIIRNI